MTRATSVRPRGGALIDTSGAAFLALAICSLLVPVENDHCVSAGDRIKWNEVVPAPHFYW